MDTAATPGQPAWQAMLAYVAELHQRSTHPPRAPFAHPWEEIGPGYISSPAWGHWDLIHQLFDALPDRPEHARDQLLNTFALQHDDGLVPGSIWLKDGPARRSDRVGHPPVWPVALDEVVRLTGDRELLQRGYDAIVKQLGWFERERAAEPAGFYYLDILEHLWESGIDEGIRFLGTQQGPLACVDATAHGYLLYHHAWSWAGLLDRHREANQWGERARAVRDFMQESLYSPETGFFHDVWLVEMGADAPMAFEGLWPMVVGAATDAQAETVVRDNLLNPERFFTPHPISTVGVRDPHFELRMWRGPAWNSMTYWAARGCANYGYRAEARQLLARALDASAAQFARTGTVWEFYHPLGGHPEDLQRKPHGHNQPCPDYLGHNPLLAMARLWEACQDDYRVLVVVEEEDYRALVQETLAPLPLAVRYADFGEATVVGDWPHDALVFSLGYDPLQGLEAYARMVPEPLLGAPVLLLCHDGDLATIMGFHGRTSYDVAFGNGWQPADLGQTLERVARTTFGRELWPWRYPVE